MTTSTFGVGSKVSFKPGPRSSTRVTGTVTGKDGQFFVVNCTDNRERKIRPGACAAA